MQLVDYGRTGARPYRWLVRPTLLRSTRGRQELSVFVDAPALLPCCPAAGG
ncbi:MAG TPA: hypothetical protein VEA99_16585 [Gemmatimonadaceae bacterium]|nr:hypothetical protein [Gemmatimonadaceae bacterium]